MRRKYSFALEKNNWEYPSPQMFYNAMLRKGWTPSERDMDTVVTIHNSVNERCWRHVQAWESLHPEYATHILQICLCSVFNRNLHRLSMPHVRSIKQQSSLRSLLSVRPAPSSCTDLSAAPWTSAQRRAFVASFSKIYIYILFLSF